MHQSSPRTPSSRLLSRDKARKKLASLPFSSPFFSDRSHCPMQGPQALARTWPPTASRSALTPSRSMVALISSDLGKGKRKYTEPGPPQAPRQ